MTVYELAVALRDYASELPVRVRSADGGPIAGTATVVAVVQEDGAVWIVVEDEPASLPGCGRAQW